MLRLAAGNQPTRTRIGQVVVLTDATGRLIAVAIVGSKNRTVCMTVVGQEPTIVLRARWEGELPDNGDYLASPRRGRSAYRVVGIRVTGRQEDYTRIEIRAQRVDLRAIPQGSKVHPWMWMPGKNAGHRVPIDVKTTKELCDRHRQVLAQLVQIGDWIRPMEIGAYNGSHHHATLKRLVAKGMAERERRDGCERSYRYRATDRGRAQPCLTDER